MIRFLTLLWLLFSLHLFAQTNVESINRSLQSLDADKVAENPKFIALLESHRSHLPALFKRYEATTDDYKRIEAKFIEAGIPPFFALIPYAESKFNASSHGYGTAGLWQFSKQSARNFGLTVKKGRDERLNAERSTEAAIHCILSLKKQFGSWYLADFAYAMGEGKLQKLIQKNGSNNISVLLLDPHFPSGTKAHFAKTLLLSAKIYYSDTAIAVDE